MSDAEHPLWQPPIVAAIEAAASAHLGRRWVALRFTDLYDRASHVAGILHGDGFSVFAKFEPDVWKSEQFATELRGLSLVRDIGKVATPHPVGAGLIDVEPGCLLLLEAIPEVAVRSSAHWRSIGYALAKLHSVRSRRFGLADFDGFFGPLRQDNRAVTSNWWTDFYAERRLLPQLRSAVDSGHLPPELAHGVERLVPRLPSLGGPEPLPSLLHGDAQQNNILTTDEGAVLIDVCPYYGHPEVDLALIDLFASVPDEVYQAYREVAPFDDGFAQRRELWRLFAYLAVIAVDGANPFGRSFLPRISAALAQYGVTGW